MDVLFHPDAAEERSGLPAAERAAMDHAVEKLEALGAGLPFPHQSAVRGTDGLRELRPRAGRSPWRALYRQIGKTMVVGAIAPEAAVDRKGFRSAVRRAERRLAGLAAPSSDEGEGP